VAKLEPVPHCYVERNEIPRRSLFDRRRYYSTGEATLRYTPGARFLSLNYRRDQQAEMWNREHFGKLAEGKRGVCRGFSGGSRRRFLNTLNKISKAAPLPEFCTATVPDEVYQENLTEFTITAKCWLMTFLKRLERVCPEASGLWRIEFQPRKSGKHLGKFFPHFHLLLWGLPRRASWYGTEACVVVPDNQLQWELVNTLSGPKEGSRCTVATEHHGKRLVFAGSGKFVGHCRRVLESALMADRATETSPTMSFQDWASLAWYHVVGSNETKALQVGWRSKVSESWGQVMAYVSSYIAKKDVEELSDVALGRQWGVYNGAVLPRARIFEIDLSPEQATTLRRTMRRYLEHRFNSPDRLQAGGNRRKVRCPMGITAFCDVDAWLRLWGADHPPDPF